jgi:hypothetical protein
MEYAGKLCVITLSVARLTPFANHPLQPGKLGIDEAHLEALERDQETPSFKLLDMADLSARSACSISRSRLRAGSRSRISGACPVLKASSLLSCPRSRFSSRRNCAHNIDSVGNELRTASPCHRRAAHRHQAAPYRHTDNRGPRPSFHTGQAHRYRRARARKSLRAVETPFRHR